MVDINRGTTGVNLSPQAADEIWAKVVELSVVQKVAQQIALPGEGKIIDLITGEATANWAAETAVKTVSTPTISSKTIQAHTLAVIVPFSNQFKRDKNKLYNEVLRRLPAAIAKKFDQTAFGYFSAPGANFDTLAASPEVSINTANTAYAGLLSALGSIAAADGELTHILSSTQGRVKFLGQLDSTGNPIFNPNFNSQLAGSLFGVPYVESKNVYRAAGASGTNQILAIAGDWANSAYWGVVGGINVDLAEQATVTIGGTPTNLWERNMFAVRVECEVGFAVADDDRFVKLTGTPGA